METDTFRVHSRRRRGNGQKLEHGKFLTQDNENVFNVKVVKNSTRSLREMVEFTSLELLKLNMALSNLI